MSLFHRSSQPSAPAFRQYPSFAQQTSTIFSTINPAPVPSLILNHPYPGRGTLESPHIVSFLPQADPYNPLQFTLSRKWTMSILLALSTFAVTFASSIYASAIPDLISHFHVSIPVATLGLSLYVLGFALGPVIWGPLSELYGRKPVFFVSYTGYVAFSVGTVCAGSIGALLSMRLLASVFGASVMTNTGAVLADMFVGRERGVAMAVYVTMPFLGPAFGPIIGGFLAESQGWRWTMGLVAILAGTTWITSSLAMCETYAPVILRRRAEALSRMTGKTYISRLDAGKAPTTLRAKLSVSLMRPWILLFCEPIVLVLSLYISIIYGTLYMFFGGFPIVFERTRGWSQGLAGLPFVGVAFGVCLATLACGMDNKRYVQACKAAEASGRTAGPEARLGPAMVGSIILPVGLFLFAWTTYPSVHWILPVIGAVLFACGLVMVFISLLGYLTDCYVIYAASAMAANSMLRSLFGAAFPMFTTQMYDKLGNQWASSIPAFLVLGCVPFPFLLWKFGPEIRSRCRYAAEAAEMMEKAHQNHAAMPKPS